MSLLEDLQRGVAENTKLPGCPLCKYINAMEDPVIKQALTEAAAGTIGRDKFAAILKKHNTGIGQKTIRRHRLEGHTP